MNIYIQGSQNDSRFENFSDCVVIGEEAMGHPGGTSQNYHHISVEQQYSKTCGCTFRSDIGCNLSHLGLGHGARIKALAGGKSRVAAVPNLRFKEK